MSRYLGPRVKKLRRLQTSLPGLSTKSVHDLPKKDKKPKPLWKQSQYSKRLQEKQKMSLHYGLTERQLLKYIRIAGKTKGETSRVLLQLLEMRLDNILFRLGMATTLPGARQLVTHRHILVNGRVVDIPSYRCKPHDTIEARYDQSRALIQKNLSARIIELNQDTRFWNLKYKYKELQEKRAELARKKVPDHLTLQRDKGLVNKIIDPYPGKKDKRDPGKKDKRGKKKELHSNLGVKINALGVVEYYSRQI